MFHAGRIFPEWDIEQRPLIWVRFAHPPSPQGEGMEEHGLWEKHGHIGNKEAVKIRFHSF